MKLEGFTFQCDSLDYRTIENAICKYYQLGYASDSDFSELEEGKPRGITIIGTSGSVECGVSAYMDKKSGNYSVRVSCADVKYNDRRYR